MQKLWQKISDQTSAVSGTVTYTQDDGADFDAYVVWMTPLTAASGLCELRGIDSTGTEFTITSKTGILASSSDAFASIGEGVKTSVINNWLTLPTCFPLKWVAVSGAGGTIRLRIFGVKVSH